MPIGGGILPASGTNQYNELTYVTRRAFIPKLVVQIYNSTPLMAALIANSQTASGGVSSVSVPVQGSQFVNAQWSDYSGSFAQPSVQQGAYQAEFNLKLLVSPVPFLGMEGAVQQDYAIIPLIEARMNDATNVMMDSMATALYNNTSNNQQFIGLPAAVDDGTGTATYGNINRSTNTWWKSKQYAAGSVNPTRQNVLQYISGTVKNGAEVPTFGVCGFGTWTLLAQDYVGQENYMITPGSGFDGDANGPQAAFRALMVAGRWCSSDDCRIGKHQAESHDEDYGLQLFEPVRRKSCLLQLIKSFWLALRAILRVPISRLLPSPPYRLAMAPLSPLASM